MADLERVRAAGDVSIASNKIYLAFGETRWRPTIYTVADWCVAENNASEIRGQNLVKLFPEGMRCCFGPEFKSSGRTIFFRQIAPPPEPDEIYQSYFTHDLMQGVFVGETITNLNIQIAAYLGCSEIYLIGVDGRYVVPDSRQAHQHYSEVLVSQGEVNHFHPDYRKPGETWSVPRPAAHERNYAKCMSELRTRGVVLANASRLTAVKAVPRINFDSLF